MKIEINAPVLYSDYIKVNNIVIYCKKKKNKKKRHLICYRQLTVGNIIRFL